MGGLPWFRMYVDFLEDPKILSLAFEDQRHFIGILALKCEGVIDQKCKPEIMNKIVAQKLWIDHSSITEVKRRLIEAELIDENWQPLAWERRQCRSDHDPTGAERQKRYREKRNALRNATVTPPDKIRVDTEEEVEKNKEKTRADGAAADAANDKISSRTPDELLDYANLVFSDYDLSENPYALVGRWRKKWRDTQIRRAIDELAGMTEPVKTPVGFVQSFLQKNFRDKNRVSL